MRFGWGFWGYFMWLCLENYIFDKKLDRIENSEQQGLTVRALLRAVMSWHADEGLVAPMSLCFSWCLLSILCSRSLYQPQWNLLICMRLMLTHLSKCHSLCACISQGWSDPKTLWLEPWGWDISDSLQWKHCCTGWQGLGYTRPPFVDVHVKPEPIMSMWRTKTKDTSCEYF